METIESIKTEFVRPVRINVKEKEFEDVMKIFENFTMLPDKHKHSLDFEGDVLRRNTSAGYSHTSATMGGNTIDTSKDNKHIFHYTPDVMQQWHRLSRSQRSQVLDEFVDKAQQLWFEAAKTTKVELERFEEFLPGIVALHFPPDGATNHHLRFLAYEPGVDGVLARGHYDKSTATIALAESHGGLRLGQPPPRPRVV